ncbi:MAG: hypothetical protein ABI992_02100 [Chthoniobacterales bacterium]
MKRFLVLSFVAVAAALGLWFALRSAGPRATSSETVTALLPKETLTLVYLPDFKRSRAQWHETELYKLWREPAVQDFMQRPLARLPRGEKARQKLAEMESLEMRDAFFAVTAVQDGRPTVVAGFRFQDGQAHAEKVIGPWRARLKENLPGAKSETVNYEGHEVELVSKETTTAATVYDRDWFFVSNDVPSLKAVLDRVDRRVTETATTLLADPDFVAAGKHLPSSYAIFGYARLDRYFEKLAAKFPADDKRMAAMRQIREVAATSTFAEGKMRDVVFVGMPKVEGSGDLTRSSLDLATKETFLYAATILNLPSPIGLADNAAGGANLPAPLRRLLAAGAASGITVEDLKAAFGDELGVIGDWPAESRIPSLCTALPVKDAERAGKILAALATSAEGWTSSEQNGVQYYMQPASNPMLPVAATIGLSPQLLVAGLDRASVEAAIKRHGSGHSALGETDAFKAASAWVPQPTKAFAYADLALLYQRLDAALRPMLVMVAAFVPSVAQTVDLGKLPAAEIITKHLSPLVMSQSYRDDGYLLETVGPISLGQAVMGGMVFSGVGTNIFSKQMQAVTTSQPAVPVQAPSPSPAEEPSPDATFPTPIPTP